MIVGSLGEVVFEVSASRVFSPEPFTLSRDIKYEDHEVPGYFPQPEYIAPDLFSASLDINLRRDFGCDPYEEVQKLEFMALAGEILTLVIGNINIGNFTIRKISQTWKRLDGPDDGPSAIGLSLDLKEYC